MYLELAYHWDGKVYRLSSACRAWRDAKQPKKALALTNRLLDMPGATERKFRAVRIMARGGALRDMDMLSDAEECAWEAIRRNESHHPHNLLGVIYFQFGQPGKGYQHFLKAKEFDLRPATEK